MVGYGEIDEVALDGSGSPFINDDDGGQQPEDEYVPLPEMGIFFVLMVVKLSMFILFVYDLEPGPDPLETSGMSLFALADTEYLQFATFSQKVWQRYLVKTKIDQDEEAYKWINKAIKKSPGILETIISATEDCAQNVKKEAKKHAHLTKGSKEAKQKNREAMKLQSKMTHLSLKDCKFPPYPFLGLQGWLPTDTVLTSLDLTGMKLIQYPGEGKKKIVNHVNVDEIIQMLAENKTLRSLNLSDNKSLGDDGFQRLLDTFMPTSTRAGNLKLRVLTVVSCGLKIGAYETMIAYLEWKLETGEAQLKVAGHAKDFGLREINYDYNLISAVHIQTLDDIIDKLDVKCKFSMQLDHNSPRNRILKEKRAKATVKRNMGGDNSWA
jgi:hypothetical protein